MAYIEKIEIQYFRSIYREVIKGCKDLNVFTGKNDVGKSNILKALNLFFNNETDVGVAFDFIDNFNLQRLEEVRKISVKGKQYIQIKVTFNRGQRSEQTLPKQFTVVKKWLRNDVTPSIYSDDLQKRLDVEGKKYGDRNRSSLTAYMNKIKYIYIPAIKDQRTFRYTLEQLRDTIYNDKLLNDKDLIESMQNLANRVSLSADELNKEFELSTGISSQLASPKSISDLYKSMEIETMMGDTFISLDKRGDGIRVRYLPSILHYISSNSNNMYIWGFEEPENSLEYNLAYKMANEFEAKYCKYSMILVTTHSPAFIGLTNQDATSIYRCFKIENKTRIMTFEDAERNETIEEELGYVALQKEHYEKYNASLKEHMTVKGRLEKLQSEVASLTKPILFTEGKTDVMILKCAWEKLYNSDCPFEIKNCNLLNESDDCSAAGCGILCTLLKSIRFDNMNIIIGLFDCDQEGKKSYELNKYFTLTEEGWKQHRHKKAFALLLPVPKGKEIFAQYDNLCIEYYFSKEDLEREIDGVRLKFKPCVTCHGKIIHEMQAELHYCNIDETTKVFFAEKIVPTLPPESFINFHVLFEKINKIIDSTQN